LKSKAAVTVAVLPFVKHLKVRSQNLTDKAEVFKPASSIALLLSASSGIVAKH